MYGKRYPCNLLRLMQRNLGILDHGGFFFTVINFTRNRVKKILYSEIGSSFRHEESTMNVEYCNYRWLIVQCVIDITFSKTERVTIRRHVGHMRAKGLRHKRTFVFNVNSRKNLQWKLRGRAFKSTGIVHDAMRKGTQFYVRTFEHVNRFVRLLQCCSKKYMNDNG